jgi:hypothetical protein
MTPGREAYMTDTAILDTPTTNAAAAPRATLLERTICLAVHKKKFGNSRKASLAIVDTDADKALLGLSKRLLDSPELKAISGVDHELNAFLESICMPSMFKNGVYLLPIPLVERVEDELQQFKIKRQAAVDTFLEVYPDQVRAIETRLGSQYDARNYPTVEQMRLLFDLEWQYVSFGVPGSLKAIKASLFEDEKKKYEAKMQEAAEEYRSTLRARLYGFFDALAESLKPTSDGKKRRLYESTIDKVNQALALFEMQDATDDKELAPIVARGRAIMAGVDVEQLRDDDALRGRIESELSQALADMKTMIVDRGSRAIELEDDAPAAAAEAV